MCTILLKWYFDHVIRDTLFSHSYLSMCNLPVYVQVCNASDFNVAEHICAWVEVFPLFSDYLEFHTCLIRCCHSFLYTCTSYEFHKFVCSCTFLEVCRILPTFVSWCLL